MTPTTVILSAPSRLHLGLIPGPDGNAGFFGGAGIMLSQPRTTVRLHPAKENKIHGVNAHRAAEFAGRWLEQEQTRPRHFDLNVIEAPTEHIGLGSGTQLALAIGLGLQIFEHAESTRFEHVINKLSEADVLDVALKLGRAGRTVIGTMGFQLGGLLIDWGRSANEPDKPQSQRVNFPVDWPILLVTLPHPPGLHGHAELEAFEREIQRHAGLRQEMLELLRGGILPGIDRSDFKQFAKATWEFGIRSGRIFETIQNGIFCSPAVADLVERFRKAGAEAVVQSSWGPTIGVVFPSTEDAARVAEQACRDLPDETEIHVTTADNRGTRIETDYQLPQ